jgi:hypothetical protein
MSDLSANAYGAPSPLACANYPVAALEALAAARFVSKRRPVEAMLMLLSAAHGCSPVAETDAALRIAVDVVMLLLPTALSLARRKL